MIVYETTMEEAITEAIERLKLPGHTKVFGVHGDGATGRHYGDPIWPGTNNVIYSAVPAERVDAIVESLRAVQARYRKKPGMSIFVFPVEVR
ncbi:MAG TPA: hypothetical protein VHR86_10185 [Armatimonadota bacterium]|nr:hypothetical protein [Armatimonadota bacterium]